MPSNSASSLVESLERLGYRAEALNPSRWLTWHLDRASVETLAVGLRIAASRVSDRQGKAGLESLLEDCESWLDQVTRESGEAE